MGIKIWLQTLLYKITTFKFNFLGSVLRFRFSNSFLCLASLPSKLISYFETNLTDRKADIKQSENF